MKPIQKIQIGQNLNCPKQQQQQQQKSADGLCRLLPPGKLQGIFISIAIWSAGSRSAIF